MTILSPYLWSLSKFFQNRPLNPPQNLHMGSQPKTLPGAGRAGLQNSCRIVFRGK